MSKKTIPVCEPSLGQDERDYLLDAFDSGWISSGGNYNRSLENDFSKYCQSNYGITVSNGTVALHLAIKSLDLKKGDEVIVSNFNGIYAIFALLYEGIKPVFVDSEINTWNIDPEKIEEKINNNTKAILLVHIYGHPCDMDKINNIANKHNLKIIEDAAEAIGAEYKGRKTGSFGDVSTFSFFANKTITSGEGGIILTKDKKIAEKCNYFRNQCFPINGPRNFIHNDIGHNYRLTNIQAAIAYAQLKKVKSLVEKRIINKNKYQERLSTIEEIRFQPEAKWAKNVYWMTCILLDFTSKKHSRENFEEFLNSEGIQTRRLFVGMNDQPIIKKLNYNTNEVFTVTNLLSQKGIYLPSSSHLADDDIDLICEKIKLYFR